MIQWCRWRQSCCASDWWCQPPQQGHCHGHWLLLKNGEIFHLLLLLLLLVLLRHRLRTYGRRAFSVLCFLTRVSLLILCFMYSVVWLLVPVQFIGWKDSFLKLPVMCWVEWDVKLYTLTHTAIQQPASSCCCAVNDYSGWPPTWKSQGIGKWSGTSQGNWKKSGKVIIIILQVRKWQRYYHNLYQRTDYCWNTVSMKCRQPYWKCQWKVREFHLLWRVVTLYNWFYLHTCS